MVASQNIKKGDLFTNDNLVAKRTGGVGISPIEAHKLFGAESDKDYKKNQIIEDL
jgi:N,N'-diacetyllegionaminate synthase